MAQIIGLPRVTAMPGTSELIKAEYSFCFQAEYSYSGYCRVLWDCGRFGIGAIVTRSLRNKNGSSVRGLINADSSGCSYFTPSCPTLPSLCLPGLSLILRAEQKDHIPLLSTVAGVKVMIHNHNQTPFLEHEGFDIRPGIATTIGIQQVWHCPGAGNVPPAGTGTHSRLGVLSFLPSLCSGPNKMVPNFWFWWPFGSQNVGASFDSHF